MTNATWESVWARRLARHSLDRPAPAGSLVDVVRGVCGVHAQVMSAAELSLGIRVTGATRAEIRAELWERRGLVKTYGPRGTVHLLAAADLPLWLPVLRAARRGNEPNTQAGAGLSAEQSAAVLDAIGEALDDRCLTRRELGEEVVRRAGPWAGDQVFPAFGELWERWRPAIGTAAGAGLLCFGPNLGNQVTYVRPEGWLAAAPEAEWAEADALREVARRYLHAYGPATEPDFAQWLAADPTLGRRAFDSLRSELAEVDVDGHRSWALRADPIPQAAAESVALLPHFDCYLIGNHPRDRLYPGEARTRAVNRGAAGQVPVLLVDGVVAGIWERRKEGRRTAIRVEPFGRLTKSRRADLDAAAERIGAVLGTPIDLTVGAVAERPHL